MLSRLHDHTHIRLRLIPGGMYHYVHDFPTIPMYGVHTGVLCIPNGWFANFAQHEPSHRPLDGEARQANSLHRSNNHHHFLFVQHTHWACPLGVARESQAAELLEDAPFFTFFTPPFPLRSQDSAIIHGSRPTHV